MVLAIPAATTPLWLTAALWLRRGGKRWTTFDWLNASGVGIMLGTIFLGTGSYLASQHSDEPSASGNSAPVAAPDR
ncbi:MAG: hypothetical protein U0575_09235 [Phycisphaerales bacterium]